MQLKCSGKRRGKKGGISTMTRTFKYSFIFQVDEKDDQILPDVLTFSLQKGQLLSVLSRVKNRVVFVAAFSMCSAGSPCVWLTQRIWSYSDDPGQSGQPRKSSAMTQPRDHMSMASQNGRPSRISGALQVDRVRWRFSFLFEIYLWFGHKENGIWVNTLSFSPLSSSL